MSEITIREARDEDAAAIARLAALDESSTPSGAALLAFVDGELAVARSGYPSSLKSPIFTASGPAPVR